MEDLYDPVTKAEETIPIVCDGNRRKYYRFRPARFYGGIGTADCLGCCLSCLFCWSWDKISAPSECEAQFYSPAQVADRLTKLARNKRFVQVRISGNEPTLARDHLLEVLRKIPGDILFILETNGILIGHDPSYAQDLSKFDNLYVRVSLKGTTEQEFSRITGAGPRGFELQMKALENLTQCNVTAHPAVMVSFSSPENIKSLRAKLREIDEDFKDFEVEELALYGKVEERLRNAGIQYTWAYKPGAIPFQQV
jgi:uncharacterized Fe-S cluster-containing radical SAM superfamily protein